MIAKTMRTDADLGKFTPRPLASPDGRIYTPESLIEERQLINGYGYRLVEVNDELEPESSSSPAPEPAPRSPAGRASAKNEGA